MYTLTSWPTRSLSRPELRFTRLPMLASVPQLVCRCHGYCLSMSSWSRHRPLTYLQVEGEGHVSDHTASRDRV